jgi:glycosyltransferase involved in cell wall biosynthesis
MIQKPSAPKVSIGLPAYNAESCLGKALESILDQSFSDFELIISDNASTDRTEEIARSYAARDARIRYIRNRHNIGVSRNFNATFRFASGQYFKWAASDDLIAPTFVEKCVRILDEDPSVVAAFSRTRRIGPGGECLGDSDQSLHVVQPRPSERFVYVLRHLAQCDIQYGLVRSDVLRRTTLLRSFVGSDIALIGELALHGKLFEIPEFLFLRRFHAGALTSLTGAQHVASYGAGRLAGLGLRHCRLVIEHVRAVARAPLSPAERSRAVAYVIRKAVWDRSQLTSELTKAARELLGGH